MNLYVDNRGSRGSTRVLQSGQRVLPPLGDFHIFYFKKEGLEFFHEILKKNVSSLKVELNLIFFTCKV